MVGKKLVILGKTCTYLNWQIAGVLYGRLFTMLNYLKHVDCYGIDIRGYHTRLPY